MFIEMSHPREEWLEISRKFEQRKNYPPTLGAIDGKHLQSVKSNNGGSYSYNYKHIHSIIHLAGPGYECLYADVGSSGRVNNSGIWSKCSLLQVVDDSSINLPEDDYLTNDCKLSYVFLGDDAFALKGFMMKPYPPQNLTVDKRIYNTNIDIAVQGEFWKTFLVYLR